VARVASAGGRRFTRGAAVVAEQSQAQSLPRATPVAVLDRIRLLVRTLEEHPGLTAPELAERINLGRRHTSLLLLRLQEHGHVQPDGRRWFTGSHSVN
jgi:hypothetical protein